MGCMGNPSLQTLLQTAKECHDFLDAADIPHVVIGGLAVCLHGCKRNSRDDDFRDVDLLVCRDDWRRIQQAFDSAQYVWDNFRKAYISPTGVRVDRRFWDEEATIGEAPMPHPAQFCDRDGLPVLKLLHLIENKLACAVMAQRKGGRRARRSKKHFRDVVGLITVHDLDGSYADNLHESVRAEFRKLVAQASGP